MLRRALLASVLSLGLIAFVGAAVASAAGPPATMTMQLAGVKHHEVLILDKVTAKGTLKPATPGQQVDVQLIRGGSVVAHQLAGAADGSFKAAFKIGADGKYRVRAEHADDPALGAASAVSNKFGVRYPDLRSGNRGPRVRLFNRLLQKRGYIASDGGTYTAVTGRGVMAFRKVNGMRRTFSSAGSDIFRKLARGNGGYHLLHPEAGRHAEVSIRRQVLVLANGGNVFRIYHVSTGAPATPTIRGHFNFYRREPGYNSKQMFDSFYFHGGYAIHGYHDVPAYNASHGCVRTPIPDQKGIYNWLQMGDSIFVY
ncbi:MAG: hypothetical protein QOG09_1135 [Solirubrobacterales bacterium]|nr:hypothetical protein [Solirubrobacterales bacterium]